MTDRTVSFFDRIKLSSLPAAHPKSMIVAGQARFTLLTSRLIRLEWSTTGEFEDRATFAFPTRYAEPPIYQVVQDGTQFNIRTEFLDLKYTATDDPFDPTNLSITVKVDSEAVIWQPGMIDQDNLRGTRRTLDQCGDVAPLQEGLLSRAGWSLFDDSGSVVWDTEQIWVQARFESHQQDWYFFGYGHDYKAVLAEYVRFGGAIPLIPRYVLGGWWSRFWPYSTDDLEQLVEDFQAHEIPLDVLVVDMDWHTPDGWTGYTWNRSLFPDPTAFLAWAHSQKLHVTLNLHPAQGVQRHEEVYPQFAALLGHDPQNGNAIQFAPADKSFMQHYFELLHHPLEDQGVDFWWLDWQQGESSDLKGLDPLPWLNHLHFQDSTRRGQRPMLYSRWGGLGNHRYPIGFSGDTYATWESLRFQVYFTPTAANVGYGWWSHDIGGHFGATEPELYARWVQFGAVSPCLRLHATNDPLAERRPWAFSLPVYEAAKAAFQFRYRLLPYLYSAARDASQRGLSLCTPMYYEFPACEDAYLAHDQYFLGDQMFVAPITQPTDPGSGLAAFDVWIPPGTWIEYTTGQWLTGPRWIHDSADLNRIPMYVRAGGIIPMAESLKTTQDWDGSHLILTVFPGADGQLQLYEDDGLSQAYQHGEYETTLISFEQQAAQSTFSLSLASAEGHCPSLAATRTIEVRFREVQSPQSITINGVACTDWAYDVDAATLTVIIPDADRRQALTLVATADVLQPSGKTTLTEEAPFVHHLAYTIPQEAKRCLATVVIVPPADLSAFDADIKWTLFKGDSPLSAPHIHLDQCHSEQVLNCPFADQADLNAYRWSVSVDIAWRGEPIHYGYQSPVLRPGINRWQTLIYNLDQQPLRIADVLAADNTLNPDLAWTVSEADHILNLKQPYGIVFLESDRAQLIAHEPLEACLSATLLSAVEQEIVLYVQCAGTAQCYLNGHALDLTQPASIPELQPMFYSWMSPTRTYYRLPLQAGKNELVIFTQPKSGSEWWGLGATLIDQDGNVLVEGISASV